MAATILDGTPMSATLIADEVSDYQQRKVAGTCTYRGCEQHAADDSSLCPGHRDAQRERVKLAMRRNRKEWRKAGRCTRCGKKRAPGSKWGCAKCIVALGATNTILVTTHVNKSQRIAARTVVDADNRTRYRGQDRRGRQSNGQIDEQDLADAIKRLERAKAGLAYARSPEVQQLPRAQRDDVKREALAQADHGARFVEEVLERNRYGLGNMVAKPRNRGR